MGGTTLPSSGSILITTINGPTNAVKKIASDHPDWHFIVIGDTKTPADWAWPGVTYLSVEAQIAAVGKFAERCPTRHYARKNVGYLKAIADKSPIVAETDDDNIPYDTFLRDVSRQITARPVLKKGWDNVYTHFTTDRIWPRGFPLELVNDSFKNPSTLGDEAPFDCPIQQSLADGDPDVDAVYRLTIEAITKFRHNSVVLQPGTYCPFNSQNTIFWPETYPLLYLPAFVSFRMTDIWRSFIAQSCLYAMGKPMAFRHATVLQERNEHSLIRDFQDELPGYLNNPRIMEILEGLSLSSEPAQCAQNLGKCYEALISAGIVPSKEMQLVELWIESVSKAA
jgi:STELLO glycosyltransferases